MFAFETSEKIHFLFFAVFGKFLIIFKKFHIEMKNEERLRFNFFFKDYAWFRLLAGIIPSHFPLFWGWGKKEVQALKSI